MLTKLFSKACVGAFRCKSQSRCHTTKHEHVLEYAILLESPPHVLELPTHFTATKELKWSVGGRRVVVEVFCDNCLTMVNTFLKILHCNTKRL